MHKFTTYHKTLLFLLFFVALGFTSKAQKADSATYLPNKIYYWGGFHLGLGTYFFNGGLDAGLLLKNTIVIAAKTDINANLRFLGPPLKHNEAHETALMLGIKLTHNRYSNWMLLSGISAISIKDRGEVTGNNPGFFGGNTYADDVYYHGIGIPAVVKFTITPARILAMDFSAAANINPKRTFFALTFGLAFGSVRSGPNKDLPPGNRPGLIPRFPALLPHH